MFAFIIKRVLQAFFVMLIISVIGFVIKQSVGDPIREITGISVKESEREALRDKLGLNDPLFTQWTRFVGNAMKGDLGNSFYFKRPAMSVIISKAPATLELVMASSLVIVLFSIPIGIYAAVRPNAWLARFFMGASIVGVSIPVFLTAIILIYIFSVNLGWLPSFGRGGPGGDLPRLELGLFYPQRPRTSDHAIRSALFHNAAVVHPTDTGGNERGS